MPGNHEFLHTAFHTIDIEASVLAWQEVMGASIELPRVMIAADEVDVCILTLNGTRIELIQPHDENRAHRLVREAKGHPDHVCLRCESVEEMAALARAHGGVVVRPPANTEAFQGRMCFILYRGIGLVEWVER